MATKNCIHIVHNLTILKIDSVMGFLGSYCSYFLSLTRVVK
jgi:hypothetical protein